DPSSTGCSWLRLNADLPETAAGDNKLTVSANTAERWWSTNDKNNGTPDQVVVTTTDYLPRHSELLTITSIAGTTLSFQDQVTWPHRGTKYTILDKLGGDTTRTNVRARFVRAGMDQDIIDSGAETRAAVALLTRSIRIISGGDTAGQTFEDAGNVR